MHDVFGFVARPFHIGLASGQRSAHGVHARHKCTVCADYVVHRFAHAGHDALVDRHVGAVREFDTDVGNVRAHGAHAERHHIHGAAFHASVKQRLQSGAHLGGRHPVVGGACVFFFLRANVGAVFYARYVAGVRPCEVRAWALGGVELFESARVYQLLAKALVFLVTAITPVNGVWFAQGGHLGHPSNQFGIFHISGCVHLRLQS